MEYEEQVEQMEHAIEELNKQLARCETTLGNPFWTALMKQRNKIGEQLHYLRLANGYWTNKAILQRQMDTRKLNERWKMECTKEEE